MSHGRSSPTLSRGGAQSAAENSCASPRRPGAGSSIPRLPGLLVLLGASGFAQDTSRSIPDISREAPPVPVEVQVRFPENISKGIPSEFSGWVPVCFELSTLRSGTQTVEVTGSLWSGEMPGKAEPNFETRRLVEVNPGASRRVWIYLHFEGTGSEERYRDHIIQAKVLSGDRTITTAEWRLSGSISASMRQGVQVLPAIMSGEKIQLVRSPWGNRRLKLNDQRGIDVEGFAPVPERNLPDQAIGYQSVQLVVLRNFAEGEMEESQIEAIRDWVQLGGFLVLVPGGKGEIFSTRLARALLPQGSIGDLKLEEGFSPSSQFLVTEKGFQQPLTEPRKPSGSQRASFLRLDPVSARGDREIFSASSLPGTRVLDNRSLKRLYHEHSFGLGKVGVLTIDDLSSMGDLSTLNPNASTFQESLWERILAPLSEGGAGSSAWSRRIASCQDRRLVQFLKGGLSQEMGMWFIGFLVVAYLLVIGPGLYFFLKRINRLPWVVWLEPLVVVASIGLIFLVNYLSKGALTQTRTVTLLHWRTGEPLALKESYLGIFSSDETYYRISTPQYRWLRPIFENEEEAVRIRMAVGEGEEGRAVPAIRDFRLDVWQAGVFGAADLEPLEGGIVVSEQEGGAGGEARAIQVRNRSGFTIKNGFLYDRARRLIPTGPIAPGGSVVLEGKALERSIDFAAKPRTGPPGAGDPKPEAEDPFAGDPLGREAMSRVLGGEFFPWPGAQLVFTAILDRREEDFVLNIGATQMHRFDLLMVYR